MNHPLVIILESFFASVLVGGVYTWVYNRFVAPLRESYLKKGMALGIYPVALAAGIGHAFSIIYDWPSFRFAAYLGIPVFAKVCWDAYRRRQFQRGAVRSRIPLRHGLDYERFPLPVRAFLKLIRPLNEVDRLEVLRIDVPLRGLHPDMDGFRIVFLTDYHVHPVFEDDYFREVVRAALALKPGAILSGGDFISRRWNIGKAREVLSELARHPRVFGIRGNHDFWSKPSRIGKISAEIGIQNLSNEAVLIERGGGAVVLVGLEDPYIPLTPRREASLREETARLSQSRGDAPLLGLAHTPEAYPLARRLGCQAVLGGHTHGGQIRLPVFGTTLAACSVPAGQVYGIGRLGEMVTITSNGLGAFFPFRFFCPPQVVEVTLRRR